MSEGIVDGIRLSIIEAIMVINRFSEFLRVLGQFSANLRQLLLILKNLHVRILRGSL